MRSRVTGPNRDSCLRTAAFATLRSIFAITDKQALWRTQTEEDDSAFAQLVASWHGPIQLLCIRMTGYAHPGDDLAQETFARVFAKRKDYQRVEVLDLAVADCAEPVLRRTAAKTTPRGILTGRDVGEAEKGFLNGP